MTIFQGLSAFPLTPTDAEGRVQADDLRRLLTRLVDAEVHSIGLLGSTGTFAYLDRDQRRRAIEIAVAHVGGKVPILAGIGALRTDDTVRFGQDAKAAGADAVLVAPVSYLPLNDEDVFVHLETVAASVDLPLCIYNNPITTHFTFGPDLIGRLSRMPNVVAVKTPAPAAAAVADDLRALRAACRPGFAIGYSMDRNAGEAVLAGGEAWYSVIGGTFPRIARRIVMAARAGDAAETRRLVAHLDPLWRLGAEVGSIRVMYAAANLLGLTDAQPPRPVLPLAEPVRRRVADLIASLGLE